MSQSLAQIYTHLVFSTKHRRPYFPDPGLRNKLFGYLAGACKKMDSPALTVGGHVDHVHVLCRLGKEVAISVLVRELKRESSKWLKPLDPSLAAFCWQNGYGAFSVSPGHVDALRTYIANQDDHHSKTAFQDEFRRICKKYGLAVDERYCWN